MEIRKKRGYEKMLKETGYGRKVGIAVSTIIFMLSFPGPLLGRVANTQTPHTRILSLLYQVFQKSSEILG